MIIYTIAGFFSKGAAPQELIVVPPGISPGTVIERAFLNTG